MAQRGGTVEVHVRLGSSYGPLIPLRTADAIVGLGPAECVRFARYVSPNGTAIVNTCPVPAPGITYPTVETLVDVLSLTCQRVIAYNATKLALEAGNSKTLNVVMLGTLSRFLPLSTLEGAIADNVPTKALAANLKAFQLGKNAADSVNGQTA